MAASSKHAKCLHCPTRKDTEWQDLAPEFLELIDQHKSVRDFEIGEIIYSQGQKSEGVYCIQSGLIGLRKIDADGNEVLLRLCKPGETIGYRALLTNCEHGHFAEVLAPSHICFINRTIVTNLLSQNPIIGERFLIRSLKELSETEEKFIWSKSRDVRSRFLHCLMVLFEQYGYEKKSGGFYLEIPVSRRDLASLIAVAPESISRIIKRLEEDDIVHFEGRNAYFSDLDVVFEEIGIEH